jgi:hypothetical protein
MGFEYVSKYHIHMYISQLNKRHSNIKFEIKDKSGKNEHMNVDLYTFFYVFL